MAKGDLAKNSVIDTIKSAFGEDFIGVDNRKIYVWAKDGAEKVQIAISLTCPKTPIGDVAAFAPEIGETPPPQEITPTEDKELEELMKRLGL